MYDVQTYLAYYDDWVVVQKKPKRVEAMLLIDDVTIDTLEGTMIGRKGDYLIRGTKGELYPVKPDIFIDLYEEV